MVLRRGWIAVAFGTLLGTPAQADLSFNALGDPGEPKVVVVKGDFTSGQDLRPFIEIVRSSGARMVVFHSPGGNVLSAMELGRLIRAGGMTTVQLRGLECSSACALAFMGGTERVADPGSIGVHKSSFASNDNISTRDAVAAVQQLTAEVIGYMVEMGVDPALLQLSLRYEADDIRYLSGSEMRDYRVTTEGAVSSQSAGNPVPGPRAPARDFKSDAPSSNLPVARTGRVLHPKGSVPLKAEPSDAAPDVLRLSNGAPVQILESIDRWYKVRRKDAVGYLHHTWLYVDQYESGPFGERHIQIKSARTADEVLAFSRVSTVPISVYLATNGWFAVTVEGTFEQERATALLQRLKAKGAIPQDSFTTFGTTYVKKICCN